MDQDTLHLWCSSVFCFFVRLLRRLESSQGTRCDKQMERQVPYVLVRNKLDVDIELLVQAVKGWECFDKLLHRFCSACIRQKSSTALHLQRVSHTHNDPRHLRDSDGL